MPVLKVFLFLLNDVIDVIRELLYLVIPVNIHELIELLVSVSPERPPFVFLYDHLILLYKDFGPCCPPRPLLDGARDHFPLFLKVDFGDMWEFTRRLLFLVYRCLAFGYEIVALRDLRGVSFLGQLRDTHILGDFPVDIPYA